MANNEMPRGSQHGLPWKLFCLLLLLLAGGTFPGCTRKFFRKVADKEVAHVLKEKDLFPKWGIRNYFGPYPDPRARFANPANPDRPPMPPDDLAAKELAPNPQKPRKVGIARLGGKGYLEIIAAWDRENRARLSGEKEKDYENGAPEKLPEPEELKEEEILQAQAQCPLEYPKEPYLITLDQSIQLGLFNSREFQNRREDLYLTALPVTLERFSFAAQFFFTEEAVREVTGRKTLTGKTNRWSLTNNNGFTKLFSTGALLVYRFANETVINLTGDAPHTVSVSAIDLDIVQPFLRGGGRAVTLEPLTQSERNLVYEIRDYARFQRLFFVDIAAGSAGNIGGVGGSAITLTTGGGLGFAGGVPVGTIAGITTPEITPGVAGRVLLGTGPGATAAGYLPTLRIKAFLANERKNLNNLTKTLATIDEFEKGGRIDYLQVANVEQDKLSSESNVERLKQDLKTSLDRFKLQLGLPADFPLDLDDTPIRPIENHLEKFERTIAEAQDVRVQLQELYNEKTREEFLTNPEKLRTILFDVLAKHPLIRGTKFQKTLAEKRQKWRNIPEAERKQALEIAAEKYGILNKKLQNLRDEAFLKKIPLPEKKIADLNRRLDELKSTFNWAVFEGVLREFEAKKWVKLKNKTEKFGLLGRQFIAVLDNLAPLIIEPREERLTELSTSWPKLPPITVGGINLLSTPEDIAQEIVKQSALTNRLDLMNARAQVVDAWRQIAVFANSLLGVFNVRYRFNTTTPFGEAKPFNFDPSRNTHQLFLNAELPLVRKAERNNYRASLIAFERARRGLMASEDTIVFTVRNEIRELLRLAEVYRIQRRAVELAYPQVESSNEELFGPVNPDVLNRPSSSGENAALTQQLLRNQAALVRAQNNVYDVWVDYLITRLRLLRDIEQLPLDFPGVGIDDTSTTEIPDRSRPERLPPPNPIPADPVQNANPL